MIKAITGSKVSRFITKEVLIYLVVLVAFALFWHSDLLSAPLDRLDRLLSTSQVSPLHPFIWSGIVYAIIGFFRAIFALQKRPSE